VDGEADIAEFGQRLRLADVEIALPHPVVRDEDAGARPACRVVPRDDAREAATGAFISERAGLDGHDDAPMLRSVAACHVEPGDDNVETRGDDVKRRSIDTQETPCPRSS